MSTESATKENIAPSIICKNPDDVSTVSVLPDYCLAIEFIDGTTGKVFMKDLIFSQKAGVFSVLKDPAIFAQAYIEYGAVTWPGELDLAPDAMYEAFKKDGQWVLK